MLVEIDDVVKVEVLVAVVQVVPQVVVVVDEPLLVEG